MRIVIVGGGVVGSNLAKQYGREGHDVSVVDPNPAVTRRLSERLDVLAVTGSGTSEKTLREAGIEEAEMLVAVSGSDEVNILACRFAKEFGVKRKIARVRNAEFGGADSKVDLKELGVDLAIHPEEEIVKQVRQVLRVPGTTEVAMFAGGSVLLHGFKVASSAPIAGKRIAQLAEQFEDEKFLIAAIMKRNVLTIPSAQTLIEGGDIVFVISSEATFSFVQAMILGQREKLEKVVISGATEIGRRLAGILEDELGDVTLIEADRDMAELAAGGLDKTLVLNGDPRDRDIQIEAGIANANFFIAVAEDDEENMLTSLIAQRNGAKHTICLTENPDYIPVLESIGIDVVLNPRVITVSKILELMRKARIVSGVRLHESDAEVLELEAIEGSRAIEAPLKDLRFPAGAIVAAILRNGAMEIPDGRSQIRAKDKVIVFSKSEALPAVEKLFSAR
ncbi:MAG TPA: Trk system potassium transporter TrkA [Planctomycetota bacterium]|nr:Trk system potassium transporter TrkA [Planctomycetota bacterium]